MMNLDVALPERSVEMTEIESAHLAMQGLPQLHCPGDLAGPERAVTLTMQSPAGEETSFNRWIALIIDFVRVLWELVQLASTDALPQGISSLEHLGRPGDEGCDHYLVPATTFGRGAAVGRVVRGQVGCLVADAADRSELRNGLGRTCMDGQRPEELGEVAYAGVAFTELSPAVLDHESAGQQQFVVGPVRASRHGPYRMSVRCHVWGGRSALMRDAHLKAVALSVGSVTLCDDWWGTVPVGLVWKEGA